MTLIFAPRFAGILSALLVLAACGDDRDSGIREALEARHADAYCFGPADAELEDFPMVISTSLNRLALAEGMTRDGIIGIRESKTGFGNHDLGANEASMEFYDPDRGFCIGEADVEVVSVTESDAPDMEILEVRYTLEMVNARDAVNPSNYDGVDGVGGPARMFRGFERINGKWR